MLQGLVWRQTGVVCVCFFSKTALPLYLKVLHDTLGSQRCSRGCSGVLLVASLEETQGVLSRFDSVYLGYITQGGAVGDLVDSGGLVVVSLKETRGSALVGSGGLAVASLEETWGLLSRFDCVYSGYVTQGCPGGALAVAMSLRARCFFFPTHVSCCSCLIFARQHSLLDPQQLRVDAALPAALDGAALSLSMPSLL